MWKFSGPARVKCNGIVGWSIEMQVDLDLVEVVLGREEWSDYVGYRSGVLKTM